MKEKSKIHTTSNDVTEHPEFIIELVDLASICKTKIMRICIKIM